MKIKKLLEQILLELQNIHYHQDRMEVFYMMVHGIKEDGKTGAWREDVGGKVPQGLVKDDGDGKKGARNE